MSRALIAACLSIVNAVLDSMLSGPSQGKMLFRQISSRAASVTLSGCPGRLCFKMTFRISPRFINRLPASRYSLKTVGRAGNAARLCTDKEGLGLGSCLNPLGVENVNERFWEFIGDSCIDLFEEGV